MMKNEVTVNGVMLTRAQVEKAMKELNTPGEKPFKLGQVVRLKSEPSTRTSVRYVVNEKVRRLFIDAHDGLKHTRVEDVVVVFVPADGSLTWAYRSSYVAQGE